MNYPVLDVPEQNLIPYTATSVVGRGPVLVFAPHPDDEILGPGGAVALHCAAGDTVQIVILTDGGQQIGKPALFSFKPLLTRLEESQRAVAILGCTQVECWNLLDRSLASDATLTSRIAKLLIASQARLVYAPSPYEIHPDHRALAFKLAEAANYVGGDAEILGYEISGTLHPNLLIDISTVMNKKLTALKQFRSQLTLRPYDKYIEGLNRYRTYTLSSQTQYAEAYLTCHFYDVLTTYSCAYPQSIVTL